MAESESLQKIKIFAKATSKRKESIDKMNLIELKEVLSREEALLKNKFIISKLPDKGNSIKIFHEHVQKEIKHREDLANIENGLGSLNITETDIHTQRICELETSPKKERYKPFSTLNKVQEFHTSRKVFKTMEDWSKCNRPTKLIPLTESLKILKQQDDKIKDEQSKMKHRLLIYNQENNDKSENSDTDDDQSLI